MYCRFGEGLSLHFFKYMYEHHLSQGGGGGGGGRGEGGRQDHEFAESAQFFCRENLSSLVQLMAAVFVNFKSALVISTGKLSYKGSCPNFFGSY